MKDTKEIIDEKEQISSENEQEETKEEVLNNSNDDKVEAELSEPESVVAEAESEVEEEKAESDEINPGEDDSQAEESDEENEPVEYSVEKIKKMITGFKPLEYFDFVNLHIHSKYSDGKADFLDILKQAKTLGYKKIAICDHNTVVGHKLYQDDVLIPAVEFDCWNNFVFLHLLAYGIDVNNHVLDEFMAKDKRGTDTDIVRIFARRNVPKLINAIHEAGGIAVLAHPACCFTFSLDKFVGKLVSYGLDGIEVYYPYRRHRAILRFATLRQIKDIANKYNLIFTGGTDCHSRDIL